MSFQKNKREKGKTQNWNDQAVKPNIRQTSTELLSMLANYSECTKGIEHSNAKGSQVVTGA